MVKYKNCGFLVNFIFVEEVFFMTETEGSTGYSVQQSFLCNAFWGI
jgi:hypothetical protein